MSSVITYINSVIVDSDTLNLEDAQMLLKSIEGLKEKLVKFANIQLQSALPLVPKPPPCATTSPSPNLKDLVSKFVTFTPDFLDPVTLQKLKVFLKTVAFSKQAHAWTPEIAVYGSPYDYNIYSKDLHAVPLSEDHILYVILQILNGRLKAKYNSILLSMYRDKRVALGKHRDNERCIVANSSISTISIQKSGQRRISSSLLPNDPPANCVELPVGDNSLFVMEPGCQDALYHSVLKGMGEKESGRRISLTLREIYASPSLERPLATMIKHPGNILIVGDSLIGRENNEGIDPGLIQFGQKGRLLEPGFIRKRCTKVALPGAHILKVVKFLENYDAPESVSDLVLLVGGNDVENSYCPEINGWRFVPVGCILTHLQQLSKVIQERFPQARILMFNIVPRKYKDAGHKAREAEVSTFIRRECSLNNFVLLDRSSCFRNDKGLVEKMFSKDRIHLSTRGNGALAKIIIGSIFYPRVVTNRLIVNDD